MANKTKTSPPTAPSFVEFDPACDLQKEEALDTLIIHLPDFKKEQLRVQVNKDGVLKVSGERPTSVNGTKRSRFLKETKVPEGCDINDIRAKFTNGRLNVMMPKKKTPAAPQIVQQQPASTSSGPPLQSEVTGQKPQALAEAPISNEPKTKATSAENGNLGTNDTSHDQPKGDQMFEHGSIIKRLQGRNKLALGFGVAAVAMVTIGAFVAYKYGSDSISSPSLYAEELGLI
ncbi:hypothetical protein BVRB_5g110000 [Beta vulgaris subsp. vulgaris]|uniref:uncharacterized protein LOC104893411 n=1 Tax=Beta vulgaris subsp. vulgaris TaxID=3555 RepID=UPI00053F3691|nr:uncharacterized protein LOC104893411 [Beta vulgaris subsp. vulgaris]KMT11319.1 hypothetical protein BVRB_5g110000 [Beta vulgaris subsp. vulgaris]